MSTLVPRLVDRQVLKRLSDEIRQKMVVPHLADSEFLIRNQYFSTVHTACTRSRRTLSSLTIKSNFAQPKWCNLNAYR